MQVVSRGRGGESSFSASNKSYKVLPIIELLFHLRCLRDLQLYSSSTSFSILWRAQLRGPGAKHTPWLPPCVCVFVCFSCQMMVDIRIHNEDGGCLPGDGLVQEPLTCISKQQTPLSYRTSWIVHLWGETGPRGSSGAWEQTTQSPSGIIYVYTQLHKCLDIDTTFVMLALNTSTMDLK